MTRSLSTATVVGAGYMGGGIAQTLALAGIRTEIVDTNPESSLRGLDRLLAEAQEFEDQGLYPAGATEKIRGNLTAGRTLPEAVAEVDFIEEAVFEDPQIKREVLATISQHALSLIHI